MTMHNRALTLVAAAFLCANALTAGAAVQVGGVPALKVTAPNGKISTLIGSIHVGVQELRQPATEILFKDARLYVVESVPGDGPNPPQRQLTYGLLDGDKLQPAPWAKWMGSAEQSLFTQRLQCTGKLPPNVPLDKAAAVLLSMGNPLTAYEIAIRRCSPPGVPSRDDLLKAAADRAGVRTVGLERQFDVEPLRQLVPDSIYVRLMKLALAPDNELAMQSTVRALNAGDYDTVLSGLSAGVPPDDAVLFQRVMLDTRNAAWMSRLEGYLRPGAAVVNVGAAHLGGDRGLIALLRARGYKVETVGLLGETLPD